MNNLIKLELRRNHLKAYHTAAAIILIVILGFLYLIAAIPRFDPTETDLEMFQSYPSLINLELIISMSLFSILSAVMASRFIVEEYSGKKALLLFSYPIPRQKILDAKLGTVFAYTVITMFLGCGGILIVFLFTESLFPLCPDTISIPFILGCIVSLVYYSLLSGLLGILSLWFGFRRKSIATVIVASCILVTLTSQVLAIPLSSPALAFVLKAGILVAALVLTLLALKSLHQQVLKLEI